MEQTNMVLSAFQAMAAQNMVPKTGKAGDKAVGDFQKLLDQKSQSSAPKSNGTQDSPKTEAAAPKSEKAPTQEESALEKAKKLAEQGYALLQLNVGCVQIDPETGEVIAEYEPKEYLLAFNGTDGEIIPIGDMPAWERAQLDQLVSDFKTIDVSDPEADAMLEATDPNVKHTVAELLEKYGNELMGKVTGQVEEANPQQKDDQTVEVVDVEQAPQQLFHDVKAAPIKVGETYTEQPVDDANVVNQVDAQLAQALQTGETMVRIQLTPENLGEVTVEITQSAEGVLRIALSAHNDSTRGLLERHASDLQGMLSNRTEQSVEVSVQRQAESQQDQNQQHNYDGHNGHAQDGQDSQGRRRQREHTSPEDFLQQLRLGLISDEGF